MVQRGLFPGFNHQQPSPVVPSPDLFAYYPQSVRDRFAEFHKANPQVYDLFKQAAFRMRGTGRQRYSARTIVEVIRWDYDLHTSGDVFSVNDNFTPLYVRLLISECPEFRDFFELRTVRSRGVASQDQQTRERPCQ